MATEDLFIRLGLKGQSQVARGLRDVKASTKEVGDAAEKAGAKAKAMGAKFSRAGHDSAVSMKQLVGTVGLLSGAYGLGRLTVAGAKWGLSFNAQVESARLRFGLFTDDVQGLTDAVRNIDMNSAFNFGDLSDAAAMLGNSNIKDIPNVLQGAANAAAASGKGVEGLNSIIIALSQIQQKGRLSQEELNQLMEAQAPQVQNTIQKAYGLTAKQLQNIGGQGLDAKVAIKALTTEWTSGKLAKAASEQTKTLGGQWMLLTGNMQKAAGAATAGLAKDLEKNVLPAANRASQEIGQIFGREGLSNEEKLRQARAVIRRELGPVADDLKEKLDDAHIPEHLGDLVGEAVPFMTDQAAKAAPHVAKAFVDGWMHSGPWVKLATLLFIAKKGVDAGRWTGGGKGGGGLGGALGKATPTPVWVVNWGKMPGGGGLPGGGKVLDKTPGWGKAAKTVGKFAGPVGAAIIAGETVHALAPGFGSADHPSRAGGAAPRRQSERQIPAPGFGGGMPGALAVTTHVQIEGRNVATAVSTTNARMGARK